MSTTAPGELQDGPQPRPLLFASIRTGAWLAAIVVLTALAAIMLMPAISGDPQPTGALVLCRNNLRQLGIACHLYAEVHGGRLPGEPLCLYAEGHVYEATLFSCPGHPSRHSDFAKGAVTEESSSYTLVTGLHQDMPGDFILAYDKSLENHIKKGRNVLFLDNSVQWWPVSQEAEFQQRLAEQAEKVRSWKPPAGGNAP